MHGCVSPCWHSSHVLVVEGIPVVTPQVLSSQQFLVWFPAMHVLHNPQVQSGMQGQLSFGVSIHVPQNPVVVHVCVPSHDSKVVHVFVVPGVHSVQL